MYKIKQIPEDFTVKEISNVKIGSKGDYCYFLMKKTNYTTVRAVSHIAGSLRVKPKSIGFAGNKDKNAITEQVISVFKINENKIKNLKLKDIELKFLGKGDSPVSLGDLDGNYFEITIRNLDSEDISYFNKKIDSGLKNKTEKNREIKDRTADKIIKINQKILVPNYFGEQRFSKNNHIVGKAMIKNNFKKAVELILENKGDFEEKIRYYLEKNKNDYVGAINLIPFKIRKLYVHSYQGCLFNKTINLYLRLDDKTNKKSKDIRKIKNKKIPIIGFGTETEDKEINNIINMLLEQENVDLREFIIRKMPDLSSEGDLRDLFFEISDLKILETDNDDLNKNKKKIKVSFSLKKGCYATIAIGYMFSQDIQAAP